MPPGELGELDQNALKALKEQGLQSQITLVAGVVIGMFVVAIVCGIHTTIMYVYEQDIFGNKVKEDETVKFCWKEKVGRGYRNAYGTKTITRYFYTLDDLADGTDAISEAISVLSHKNYNGYAMLPTSITDGLTTASIGYTFPFKELQPILEIGDIIFMKSVANIALKRISNWTHTAILSEVDGDGKIFESWPEEKGVNVYDVHENWDKQLAFSVRRLTNVDTVNIENVINKGIINFSGIKYLPEKEKETTNSLQDTISFVRLWSDKYDLSSMYCSKLVWHVFRKTRNDFGEKINLDANVTVLKTFNNVGGQLLDLTSIVSNDRDDYGDLISNAYIGVTPDDIYASKHLGSDIYLEGFL